VLTYIHRHLLGEHDASILYMVQMDNVHYRRATWRMSMTIRNVQHKAK